ncbi:hypothetical protein [Streptomyces sp. NPDC002209]|uniref:hypothetical protein n=1 Tax=Streptomyces sp. NPDC002209 TaxID=3364638 RepID=UPI0036BC645A
MAATINAAGRLLLNPPFDRSGGVLVDAADRRVGKRPHHLVLGRHDDQGRLRERRTGRTRT